jgi:hypothetical protein
MGYQSINNKVYCKIKLHTYSTRSRPTSGSIDPGIVLQLQKFLPDAGLHQVEYTMPM